MSPWEPPTERCSGSEDVREHQGIPQWMGREVKQVSRLFPEYFGTLSGAETQCTANQCHHNCQESRNPKYPVLPPSPKARLRAISPPAALNGTNPILCSKYLHKDQPRSPCHTQKRSPPGHPKLQESAMILTSGVQVQHKTGRTELWGCCVRPCDTLWYRQVLELVLSPSPKL